MIENQKIFKNKFRYILLVLHSGLNILQYSICMSLLNTIVGDLPSILNWSDDHVSFLTGLVNSSNTAGAAIGSISAGYFSAVYGRRNMFIVGDILCMVGSSLGLIQNTYSFVIGRFICGIGMGILVDLITLFVMEWTFYKYRGYLCSMVCFTPLGMIISGLIGLGNKNGGSNYWRIIVSFPGILSFIHIFGYFFLVKTDSPFQLYQRHRNDTLALKSLNTLYHEDVSKQILNKIVESIHEREQKDKNKRILTLSEMFSIKSYRVRVIVCALCAISVNFSGYFIISIYTNKIITNDNSSDNDKATIFSIYTSIADLLSVAIAPLYVERVGRKLIFQIGIIFTTIMLLCMGFLAQYNKDDVIPYLLIVFKVGFGTTLSPLYPIIIGETIVEIGFIVNSLVFWVYPVLVDSKVGFSGIFWMFAAVMTTCLIFLTILMKETRGLTMKEIHLLYRKDKNSSQDRPFLDSQDKQISLQEEQEYQDAEDI